MIVLHALAIGESLHSTCLVCPAADFDAHGLSHSGSNVEGVLYTLFLWYVVSFKKDTFRVVLIVYVLRGRDSNHAAKPEPPTGDRP